MKRCISGVIFFTEVRTIFQENFRNFRMAWIILRRLKKWHSLRWTKYSPCWAAKWRADDSSSLFMLTSAPFFRRSSMTSTLPEFKTKSNLNWFSLNFRSYSLNIPFCAAKCSGVNPLCVLILTSAPFFRRISMTFSRPNSRKLVKLRRNSFESFFNIQWFYHF